MTPLTWSCSTMPPSSPSRRGRAHRWKALTASSRFQSVNRQRLVRGGTVWIQIAVDSVPVLLSSLVPSAPPAGIPSSNLTPYWTITMMSIRRKRTSWEALRESVSRVTLACQATYHRRSPASSPPRPSLSRPSLTSSTKTLTTNIVMTSSTKKVMKKDKTKKIIITVHRRLRGVRARLKT